MARVTEKEILQMNRLYQILGTYAAVGREVGRAPSTVKRYIDPNFSENESITLKQIDWKKLKKKGNHRERTRQSLTSLCGFFLFILSRLLDKSSFS